MSKTTYEEFVENPENKKMIEEEYQELLLKELFLKMQEDRKSTVRKTAKDVGLSPRIIQALKTGKQKNIRLTNFNKISHSFGYHIELVKGGRKGKKIRLDDYVLF